VNASVFMVYGPVFLPRAGHSDLSAVSYLLGIPSFVSLLSQNYWGYICLKRPNFRLMTVLPFASFTILYGLLSTEIVSANLSFLYAYLFCHGFLFCAIFPSTQTLVSLKEPDRKAELISKLFAFESLGWGLCSLVVGFLLENFGETAASFQRIFLVMCVLNVVVFCFFLCFFPAKPSVSLLGVSEQVSLSGYKRVLSHPAMRNLLFLVLWLSTGSTLFFFYFGRYAEEILGGTKFQMGVCMTLATFFGAVCFPFLGRLSDRKGSFSILLFCFVGYIVVFGILIFITSPWWFVFFYALPLYPFLSVGANAMMASDTEIQDRGIGFGVLATFFHLGSVTAPAIGFVVFRFVPLSQLPLFSTLVIIPALFFLIQIHRHKKNAASV
jgi:predicted MFS family arabinose efflux permease